MIPVGTVESVWRYPIKSMSGEEMIETFVGFSGVYGDRCYAFKNSAARKGFPYLNATIQQHMLRYCSRFRYPERAMTPPNLRETMNIAPGVTPANGHPEDMLLEAVTPSGAVVVVDDPTLIHILGEGLCGENHLTLVHSDRVLTDCRPVSLISVQTVKQKVA